MRCRTNKRNFQPTNWLNIGHTENLTMLEDSFNVSKDILKKLSALKLQTAALPPKVNDSNDGNMATETVPFRRTFSSEPNRRQQRNRTLDSSFSSTSTQSSLSSSLNSVYEDHDFTRVKSTITSDLRYKIARNEPVKSHYYREHIKTFGKPPFVLGTRGTFSSNSTASSSTKSSVSSRIV